MRLLERAGLAVAGERAAILASRGESSDGIPDFTAEWRPRHLPRYPRAFREAPRLDAGLNTATPTPRRSFLYTL